MHSNRPTHILLFYIFQIHTVTGRFPEKRLMKGAAPWKDRSSVADDIYLISVTTFRDDKKDLDF